MASAARGDAGGGAEVAALRSAGPADLKILERVAAGPRGSMRGDPPAPVYPLYGGELDRRTVTPLRYLRPVQAAGSCEWCQTLFAPQLGKRHCSEWCRSLNEDYRRRGRPAAAGRRRDVLRGLAAAVSGSAR